MRIKCPNSDIYLELPSDRTDMKFTCPACHKVHRVTISITTPGEDSPSSSQTKTVVRNQPQLPKKYATGAYPPVVDIPIDANFVLVDGDSRHQPGIDLGGATDSQRKTAPRSDKSGSEFSAGQNATQEQKAPEKVEETPITDPGEEKNESSKDESSADKTVVLGSQPQANDSEQEALSTAFFKAPSSPSEEPASADSILEAAVNEEQEAGTENNDRPPAQTATPDQNQDSPSASRRSAGRLYWDEVDKKSTAAASDIAPMPAATESIPEEHNVSPAPSDSPAANEQTQAEAQTDETWDNQREHLPPENETDEKPQKKRKRGKASTVLAAILLLAAGFLGWQQHEYQNARSSMQTALTSADTAWKDSNIRLAASEARSAEKALNESTSFWTVKRLWNTLAAQTGALPAAGENDEQAKAAVQKHLERERMLNGFLGNLDPANPLSATDALTAGTGQAAARGDEPLANAMRKASAAAMLDHLRIATESMSPESAMTMAETNLRLLSPHLGEGLRQDFENATKEFASEQLTRLKGELNKEIDSIVLDAAAGNPTAIDRYLRLKDRLEEAAGPEFSESVAELETPENAAALRQLEQLSDLISQGTRSSRTILSRFEDESSLNLDALRQTAKTLDSPHAAMSEAAVEKIDALETQAEDLLALRTEIFGRVQSDLRRNRNSAGPRLAWSMLRIGFADPEVEIDPAAFKSDINSASMEFKIRGIPAVISMNRHDYEKSFRATIGGFNFTYGWTALFHKPVSWMVDLATAMKKAGVSPASYPEWEIMEGPGEPLALSVEPPEAVDSEVALPSLVGGTAGRLLFFKGKLRPVSELPKPENSESLVEEFRQAAIKLHDGVMGDASIPQKIRQALKPILVGTYQNPDPRDYFDSSFCRRLIEADYLETYIVPMPEARAAELAAFREALGKLEAGYDEFSAPLDDGRRLVAVAMIDPDAATTGGSGDQDPETGESVPRYVWRIEDADDTVFYSPLPARTYYSFLLAEHYPGRHRTRPAGRPRLTEVWHASKGLIASYASGAKRAIGEEKLWNEAIAEDLSGRLDPTGGEPGWAFPLHVLERDDQGDPLTLATLTGTVNSPDFTGIRDAEARRKAEDEWLDTTAATLSTPGELGLIFHQFFRYCSDSPLPELPNLIGSHVGLSDTHQTVYETLERRWVGRLIGDCDDLAEFFQVLTRRQGKLSHVMQLPGHAACGYVEKDEDGDYRFVVLQTGPVMQFTAPTLNEAVEIAYRAFDRGEGMSHMTTDAVPLLLRFADEETRTPFVLSARIYEDADYAETMIEVQSYWHEHVYSAAVKAMEEIVAEDQEIGNIKELGSLYERVGKYDQSLEMRRRELEMVKNNQQASISTLLEIAQLHIQEKNKQKALEALGEMEAIMQDMIRRDDAQEFFRAMSFRSFWAMHMSRLGEAARAWDMIRYDVIITKRQMGRVADPVLRTVVMMYERMCMKRDGNGGSAAGGALSRNETRAMDEMRRELEDAFARGYFQADDVYNSTIGRYYFLGRYAIADIGRGPGLAKLLEDGPYPDEPKDHTKRNRGISEEDWEWMRITPQLYLVLALEMLDRDEYPELYNPDAAKPILEQVARAVRNGTGLGSDVAGGDDVIKAEITLSFLNRDIDAFRRCMAEVKEKDYASLYDDAALTFGLQCGMIPLETFPEWIEAFREYFPGSQHYFKVVYRAIDKENYDHALLMAEATAGFFPDKPLLVEEAEFVESIIPDLKRHKENREQNVGIQSEPPAAEPEAAGIVVGLRSLFAPVSDFAS